MYVHTWTLVGSDAGAIVLNLPTGTEAAVLAELDAGRGIVEVFTVQRTHTATLVLVSGRTALWRVGDGSVDHLFVCSYSRGHVCAPNNAWKGCFYTVRKST